MPEPTPEQIYLGTPPIGEINPNPFDIVNLLTRYRQLIDIALGDRTKPYFLVVDGQSDIDDAQAAQVGGDLTPDARIRVQTESGWQMMDPANGVGNAVGRNSIGFQASKYVLSKGYPLVYLVDLGTAGEPIESWTEDGTDSELYVNLKTKVETALASLELVAAGITELSGFGWAQGGSNNTDTFDAYKEKLRTLFIDLLPNEDWFSLRTPVAMQDIGTATGFNKMDGVITQDMMAEFPYILVYRTNDLARDFPGDGGNHLTGPAMDEAGRRMGANLLMPRPALPFTDKSIVYGDFTMWLEPFLGNGMKAIYDVATGQARLAAFNGSVGASSTSFLAYDYVAPGAARTLLSSSVAVDLLGPAAAVQGNLFVGGVLRVSDIGHVRTGEFTEAQLSNPAAAVNTNDGKGRGALLTNITDQATVRAAGSGDASGWYGTYPDYLLTPGGEKVPLDTLADPHPSSFDTRAGFVASVAALASPVPDGSIAFADGIPYIASSGATAIPDIPGWLPSGFAAYPQHFGGLVDDVWDTTCHLWIAYLYASGMHGWVPKGTYPVDYIRDRAVTGSISITLSDDATIIGTLTKQDFAGDDAITSLLVDDYTFGTDGAVVIEISGGNQTKLTEDTHYTVSGQTIDLTGGSAPYGAVATGDTIRVVSADPVIEIGFGNSTPGSKFSISGGTIDNSQRGYAGQTASGSGIVILNFDGYSVHNVVFDGGDDWRTNITNGFTDTGFTSINCNQGRINHCKFISQADLGVYLTGGADAGIQDNTKTHDVSGNWFFRCQSGGKTARQVTASHVHDNYFEECYNPWTTGGVAGGSIGGGRSIIHDNTVRRCGRRAFFVTRAIDTIIHSNIIEDFGYEIDFSTGLPTGSEISGSVAIDVTGSTEGRVYNNIIKLVDFAKGNQVGVSLSQETTGSTIQTTGYTVENNKIIGLGVGVKETDTGTGNVLRENDIRDTTTEIDVISGRRWHYRESNVEYEGIGSTPFTGPWTPELRVNNVAMGGTVNTAAGRYRRQGCSAIVTCKLSVTLPGTFPSSGVIEIWGIPYSSVNAADANFSASPNRVSNIGAAGEQIAIELPPNSSQLAVRKNTLGGVTAGVSDADLTVSTTMQIYFSMTYEVEPEAAN